MANGLFKLYANDYVKGLATAIFASVIIALYDLTVQTGFDFFKVDWTILLHNMVNAGGITLVSYLARNFLTTNKGSVLNITPNDKV